ncbi:MAG: DMT family transporter [Candidatus Heimdallarchaeota archaeon]
MEARLSKEYLSAVGQAVFVTLLWSSSWVIIKFGLTEIPPLIFAGLRYIIGAIVLVVLILKDKNSRTWLSYQSRRWWVNMAVYGIVFITITQGTQFLALSLLPAITVSFVLNLTIFVVIILSIGLLSERPSRFEIFFFVVVLIGVIIYFTPVDFSSATLFGLFIVTVELFANSLATIQGRSINRSGNPALLVTGVSMSIGALGLLGWGFLVEDFSQILNFSPIAIFYIVWLGIVNTALAFTLWNGSMRHLRAMDSTLINSTMLPQTVVLAIIFLQEWPRDFEWIGLILLIISVVAIQLYQVVKLDTSESTTV